MFDKIKNKNELIIICLLQCAKKYNVNWNKVYACSEGKEGELLLKLNGEATDKLWPQVSFIPTILINHVITVIFLINYVDQ